MAARNGKTVAGIDNDTMRAIRLLARRASPASLPGRIQLC
jgi:hypothetical protein